MKTVHHLSKSKILSGLQCPKRLYLEVHLPELAEESTDLRRIFYLGHQVGDMARQLYPGGILIEYEDGMAKALEETRRLLTEPSQAIIYEATFSCHGVLVRADIFQKGDRGYHLIEVKGSTGRKDYHLWDCAVQAWVIENAGYPVDRVQLAHVDNTFIYSGNGDYEGLLIAEDVKEDIEPFLKQVPDWVAEFQGVLQGEMPGREVGDHCSQPFECPFQSYCFPGPPEYPVTCLPRAGANLLDGLRCEGIEDIRHIPEGYLTNPTHEMVRRVTLSGQSELHPEAGEYLRDLPYPRFYLDFETIQFGVPIWAGTRPYQPLPFQWSCHREDRPGELSHDWFLDASGRAPMRPLAEKLLGSLGEAGPIFTYGAYEKTIIGRLMEMLPDLADDLSRLIERLVDLLPLARKNYYHPQMKGSWSLKSILPIIAPELDYGELDEVQEGTTAQLAYVEAIDPAAAPARRQELCEKLLAYCRMDTLGLVRLAGFFQEGR